MEQAARYWMWAKRKPDLNPHILASATPMNSYGDSWEEQAFAEDAAGTLGGSVWPPRSYSCSFCRREFRSAQALGGHMNVHRRDRARLKQSPIPPNDVVIPLNHCSSFDAAYSSSQKISTFLYNNNPNPEISSTLVSPPSDVIRVPTSPATNEINGEEKRSALSFFSPNVHVQQNVKIDNHNTDSSSLHHFWSSFAAEKRNSKFFDSMINNNAAKKSMVVVSNSRAPEKEDCVTDDLSASLNLVVSRMQTNTSSDDEVASCKRRRIEAKPEPALSLLPKLSSVNDRCAPQSEELKLRSDSVEELDLELRLGAAPKVK